MSISAPQTSMPDMGVTDFTSLVDAFGQSCTRFADRTAFTCMGQEPTFAELDRCSAPLASFLRDEQGLKLGDRVAVQLPTRTTRRIQGTEAYGVSLRASKNPMSERFCVGSCGRRPLE